MVQPLAMVDSDGVGGAYSSLSTGSALDSNLQQLFHPLASACPVRLALGETPSGSSGGPMALLMGWAWFESLVGR